MNGQRLKINKSSSTDRSNEVRFEAIVMLQKGERNNMKTYAILGSFISLAGYAIIFVEGGWLLTLGVLIAIWGNNLERKRDIIEWCDTMILRDKLKG